MPARVTDSAIEWLRGKSGTIYTQDEYSDFIVRFEFKLPPGGNNGLAIRYPGKGNPAYDGMTECQVLDEQYEQVTNNKLDPRQVHGSAYGMVAALRGYQRPAGEWNYQEVTVKGSTIKVELNGTRILDADLSKVTEFMANKSASRQGHQERPFRLRRSRRSGHVPQHFHQTSQLKSRHEKPF